MSIVRSLLMAGAVALVAACAKGDGEGDTTRTGVDTAITTKTVQDTSIITADTTIQVDTTHKEGGTTGATTGARTP